MPTPPLEQRLRELYSEVDCRIEHGAESGGHLEYVRTKLHEILEAAPYCEACAGAHRGVDVEHAPTCPNREVSGG